MTGMTDREILGDLGDGVLVARATVDDIPRIVALLAADDLGRGRESDPTDPRYRNAFDAVAGDPRQLLTVLLDPSDNNTDPAGGGGAVIGTLQLLVIAGLSRSGTTRAIIEAVRVCGGRRGSGLGTRYLLWAIDTAREQGVGLVQLTSDLRRTDAHRFYEKLGFTGSHLGMKLDLG